MNGSDSYLLAIDFGTSNTTAVARIDGRLRIITFDQERSMPSSVLLLQNAWLVGRRAVAQWRMEPAGYEPTPKRRLGSTAPVRLAGRDVAAVDVVAALLAEVRRAAQRATDRVEPERLVLTHPEGWAPSQIAVLEAAARRAGFRAPIDTWVSEPIAAARKYEADGSMPPAGDVLVFDLGGGTCDVALLGPGNGSARFVRASDGDDALGGRDFDARLLEWVLRQIELRGREDVAAILRNPAEPARLMLLDSVRATKEDLTDHESAVLPVLVGDFDAAIVVQKAVYEGLIAPDIERAADVVRRVLEAARVQPGSVAALYLTGGAAQTPAVAVAVQRAAGIAARPFGSPTLVVAEGAIHAAELRVRAQQQPKSEVPADGLTPEDRRWLAQREAEEQARLEADQRARSIPEVPQLAIGPAKRRPWLLIGVLVGVLALVTPAGVALAMTGSSPRSNTSASAETRTPTPTITTTSTAMCWDHTAPVAGTCPALTGTAALEWAYGNQDPTRPMRCTEPEHPLDDAGVLNQLWCTWPDLPHTAMVLLEFASPAAAHDYASSMVWSIDPSLEPSAQYVTNDPTKAQIGQIWSTGKRTTNGAAWQDVVNVYDDLPFVSWIATDLSSGGTVEESSTAYEQRLGIWGTDAIASVLRDGRIEDRHD